MKRYSTMLHGATDSPIYTELVRRDYPELSETRYILSFTDGSYSSNGSIHIFMTEDQIKSLINTINNFIYQNDFTKDW